MIKTAMRACREHFALAAGLSALVNILYLSPTLYMMQVYDRVVPTGGLGTLAWVTLIVTLALATLAALDALRARILLRSTLRVERLLAQSLLDRLLADQTHGAPLRTAQAVREFDSFRQALGGQPAMVLFDLPWVPLYVLVALLLHPLIALLIVVGGAVLIGITVRQETATRARSREAHAATAAAYAAQERIVTRAETVRALGMRRAMVARQIREREKGLALASDTQMRSGGYAATAKFARLLLQSLALGLAAWLAVDRQVSVGAIIAASVLLSRGLQPVEQLVAAWPALTQARSAYRMIQTLLADEAAPPERRTTLPPPSGRVECQSVWLRAGADGPALLRNISFAVPPGTVLGLIGPSGSGKTSLARVIAGAVTPDMGAVRFDGASAADWDPEELARHIGYLPQDFALLPGTVAENISRFAADADPALARARVDEQVVAAAKAAGAHAMILSLSQGYDTPLDAAGSGLSAGQRQRVALARALYGEPAILILDEPESALDTEGEAALHAAIAGARGRGATIILVTHRNGLVALADRLLVLHNGAVASFGTPAELLARRDAAKVVDLKGTGR